MSRSLWASVGLALIVTMGQPVFAQSSRGASAPANLPPSSFTGRQWVDSSGCMFIRAGVGGNVKWVPRVSRDRKHLCGQRPSTAVASATRRVAPAAVVAAPAPRRVVAAAAPKPQRIVRQAQVQPVYRPAPTATYAPTRQVQQNAYSFARPTTVRPQITRSASGKCANYRSSGAAAFTNSNSDVRCGPQKWHPSNAGRVNHNTVSGPAFASGAVQLANPYSAPAVTRGQNYRTKTVGSGVKQQFWTAQPSDGIGNVINTVDPQGYSVDWDDGRLNPYRGTPTYRQKTVSTQSNSVFPTARSYGNTATYATPTATYSTRSTPKASYVSGGRYVQVGSFGVANNANRTAAKFRNMGLPVRVSNSRGLRVVMIGPISGGSLNSALTSARRAGFGDAFIRR